MEACISVVKMSSFSYYICHVAQESIAIAGENVDLSIQPNYNIPYILSSDAVIFAKNIMCLPSALCWVNGSSKGNESVHV